ncbi:MAG: hypothetical protein DRH51_05225 [Candidatus Coatesbacteria bacterium]|nr:MAG: hypothetical protein DRH51_05225 [Candidatus Coatesbacteria bacterium]
MELLRLLGRLFGGIILGTLGASILLKWMDLLGQNLILRIDSYGNLIRNTIAGGVAVLISFSITLFQPFILEFVDERIKERRLRKFARDFIPIVVFIIRWVGAMFGVMVWIISGVSFQGNKVVSVGVMYAGIGYLLFYIFYHTYMDLFT